jgi:hypothetical protein
MGGLVVGWVFGQFVGPVVGLLVGLFSGLDITTNPAKVLTWSWKKALFGVVGGLFIGLVCGLLTRLVYGLFVALIGGLFFGMLSGLKVKPEIYPLRGMTYPFPWSKEELIPKPEEEE